MKRLSDHWQRNTSKKTLAIYLMAGDPDIKTSLALLHAVANAGADIIELGFPFSDPMAEGVVIQKANERALAQKISLRIVFDLIREFRQINTTTPIILMGYANPLEQYGMDAFACELSDCGGDGCIVVDYPAEENTEYALALIKNNLAPIFLISPTTPTERVSAIVRLGRGFCYYVSLKGVTGAGHIDVDHVADRLARIRTEITLPILVGFGIHSSELAGRIARVSDGVVIGSKVIQLMDNLPSEKAVAAVTLFVTSVRVAIDA